MELSLKMTCNSLLFRRRNSSFRPFLILLHKTKRSYSMYVCASFSRNGLLHTLLF